MRIPLALLLILLSAGCGKKPESAGPSTAQQAIEGFTGKTSVDQYKQTRQTIKDIDLKQKERFQKIP